MATHIRIMAISTSLSMIFSRFKTNHCRYEGSYKENERHGHGMFIYPDGTRYEDISECEVTPDACGRGSCVNIPGTYRCNCSDGLERSPDQKNCIGVALEGGKKKYTQTTTHPVHISMAALDPSKAHDNGPLSVMIEHSSGRYVLCTLQHGLLFQQPLNLEFAAGEELSFHINGNGTIHLSGYFMPDDDDFQQYSDLSDEEKSEQEDESNEHEESNKTGKKRRSTDADNKSKKKKVPTATLR